MHESFFGLQKRPFLAVPTLDRYCPLAGQEQTFEACRRAITRAEGPVAVLGGTGLGKSMVCLRIADAFRRSFEVILLASSQICSRRALLQSLLFELRMPYRDLNEGELRLSLLDRLQPSNENPSDGLVLIVDEAQTLSIKLLEELRMITNLTRDGEPRVRLVVCGTHRLDEMLGHPQLESLNQRLAGRCYLSPLNQDETLGYITHKIERCGASIQGVMTEEAMRMVHRAADGVPRLIDQICDQSLRMAAEIRQRPCSGSIVEAAWAGLQQLPLPWSDTGSPIEKSATTIEFGSLDEDHENDFNLVDTPKVSTTAEPLQATSLSETNFVDTGFTKPAPIYNQPTAPQAEASPFEDASPINYDDSRFQDFESFPTKVPFSPIPSAGMGLSGVGMTTPSLTYSPTENQAVGADDVWNNFLSAQRIDLKPIPKVEAVPSNEKLFGNDFEEEFALDSKSVPSATSPAAPLPEFTYDNLPLSSFETDDALAYDVESMPRDKTDPMLRPYSELLDDLSSSNLEAMTFDRSESIRPQTVYDERSRETPTRFDSGLARSNRSSILSFAEMQNDATPMFGDDRDMLVIEEDLPDQIASLSAEPPTPAVVHPYKQLFSKLRG